MLRRTSPAVVLLTVLFSVPLLPAQDGMPITPPHLKTDRAGVREPLRDEQLRRMHKARMSERQERIKKDTEELLRLATELKESVDKSNENILSVDVIRKADEIEKLAKRVGSKMRETVEAPGIR